MAVLKSFRTSSVKRFLVTLSVAAVGAVTLSACSDNEVADVSLGIFTLVLIVLTGILVSIIFNPLFVSRYMYFAIGIFWISLSVIYGQMIDHNIKFSILLIIPLLLSIYCDIDLGAAFSEISFIAIFKYSLNTPSDINYS